MNKNINIIGRQTAMYSFLMGTSLLGLFLCCKYSKWLTFLVGSAAERWIERNLFEVAYYYLIIAAVINSIVLIPVVIKTIVDKRNRDHYLQTSKIMILNIPIVILYLYIVLVSF